MLYLWTGEVAASGQGFRVLGTGESGSFRIPEKIAGALPASLTLRLYGMNAYGKVYSLNRVYTLTK
jgi:hypothetical protein